MTKLLQINSGLNGAESLSTKLANEFTSAFLLRNPDTQIELRDLSVDPVPHLDAETFKTFHDPSAAVSSQQKGALALSDTMVNEVQEADVLVLGVPMYNLGIPSTLKAWIDHIARAKITFRYTETGVEGLLLNKKAYVTTARGGEYAGTQADVLTSYLKLVLGFMGITNIEFIYAEGLSMGSEIAAASLSNASCRINEIVQNN